MWPIQKNKLFRALDHKIGLICIGLLLLLVSRTVYPERSLCFPRTFAEEFVSSFSQNYARFVSDVLLLASCTLCSCKVPVKIKKYLLTNLNV